MDLSNYADKIHSEEFKKKQHIIIKAGLVSGADEVIRNIIRKIQQEFLVKLQTVTTEKQFVLKTYGLREYFLGTYAMLYYDRVRIALRGFQNLKVSLTEIPL